MSVEALNTFMEILDERWRPIKGYEGLYDVSDLRTSTIA